MGTSEQASDLGNAFALHAPSQPAGALMIGRQVGQKSAGNLPTPRQPHGSAEVPAARPGDCSPGR